MRDRGHARRASTWVLAALVATTPPGVAMLILRHLGSLIGRFVTADASATYDFARIFSQTQQARLAPHLLIPLVLGLVFAVSARACGRRRGGAFLTVLLFLLLWLVGAVCALLLTRVNGIRFVDLLVQLLPLIDKL